MTMKHKINTKSLFVNVAISLVVLVCGIVIGAMRIEDLFVLNSLNFESLENSEECSIRVDGKYRLEFRTRINDGEQQITVCELTDLTNHYKK